MELLQAEQSERLACNSDDDDDDDAVKASISHNAACIKVLI